MGKEMDKMALRGEDSDVEDKPMAKKDKKKKKAKPKEVEVDGSDEGDDSEPEDKPVIKKKKKKAKSKQADSDESGGEVVVQKSWFSLLMDDDSLPSDSDENEEPVV